MKVSLHWFVLETGVRKSHLQPRRMSPLGCRYSALLVAVSADCPSCGLPHPKCHRAKHLAFQISRYGPFISSIHIHNNPVDFRLEAWLANCRDRRVRYIAQGNDRSENFQLHVKNEEKLCYFGSIYGLIYSKAHLPKVGAVPSAEIVGTLLLRQKLHCRHKNHTHKPYLHTLQVFFLFTLISKQKTSLHCFLWANALSQFGGGLGVVQRRFLSVSRQMSIFFLIACCLAGALVVPWED